MHQSKGPVLDFADRLPLEVKPCSVTKELYDYAYYVLDLEATLEKFRKNCFKKTNILPTRYYLEKASEIFQDRAQEEICQLDYAAQS